MSDEQTLIKKFVDEFFKEEEENLKLATNNDFNDSWNVCFEYLKSGFYKKLYGLSRK